ncbi:MAG: hypothetical protein II811_03575 [Spirochaetaceae bacterium]|nr:hypothetical protein [Spirochaetaceae bacterium]
MTREELISSGLDVADSLIRYLAKEAMSGEFMSSYIANRDKQSEVIQKQESMLQEMMQSSENMQEKTKEISANANQNIERLGKIYASIEELRGSVTKIENEHKKYASQFQTLIEQTNSISKLANAIQNISDQTNLLSFNASIEAAHAGKAGAGFRIIANEVKRLSAGIKQTTEKILQDVGKLKVSINDMEEGTRKNAESLSSLSGEAGETLERFNRMRNLNKANNENVEHIGESISESAEFIKSVIHNVHKSEKLNEQTVQLFTDCASKNQMLFNDLYSFCYEIKAILKDL